MILWVCGWVGGWMKETYHSSSSSSSSSSSLLLLLLLLLFLVVDELNLEEVVGQSLSGVFCCDDVNHPPY